MPANPQIWVVLFLIFATVASLVGVVGLQLDKRRRIQARLSGEAALVSKSASIGSTFAERVVRRIDDRIIGVNDQARRSRLRMELTQAGYFSPDAPKIYFFVQALGVLALPWLGYLLIATYAIETDGMEGLYLIGLACFGYAGPTLFVRYRRSTLATIYRGVFPDFLDLLVVCIDAGLSLNAALERVSREFAEQCRPLADNLAIFLSEVRAGRGITDGLENLSVRLDIDEARSLSTLIKQSMELGSDIGQAMRVYSDDMRAKRLLRAETLAAELPVKMLIPLGLCIFPVILIVIITPALIKVFDVLKQVGGG